LRDLFAYARLVEATLADANKLERLSPYQSRAQAVAAIPLADTLRGPELTDCSRLTTLAGVERLGRLETLKIALAPQLRDVRSVATLGATLSDLHLKTCRNLDSLDGVESLRKLALLKCEASAAIRPER
jgi:hypothetical protein